MGAYTLGHFVTSAATLMALPPAAVISFTAASSRAPNTTLSGRTMARIGRRMMPPFPWSPGRAVARIGLRMMPPFPPLSLKFRKAGFPHYGFKVGI